MEAIRMTHAWPILMILSLIASGVLARRRGWLSETGTGDLARVLVALIYPSLILTRIPRLTAVDFLTHAYLPAAVLGIAMVGLLLGIVALRYLGTLPVATRRAFLFHCLVNNYLFLPLPIVQWTFGDRGVALLFFSSLGFELTVWSLGVFLFAPGSQWRERLRGMFSPPLIALLSGITFVALRDGLGLRWPESGLVGRLGEMAAYALETMGRATIGVSMLVAGSRIADLRVYPMKDPRIWTVVMVRLVAVPLVVLGLLSVVRLDTVSRGVILIVATMPAAIVSAVFAERYGGDTHFIAGGLLATHVWALITVPLFLHFGL